VEDGVLVGVVVAVVVNCAVPVIMVVTRKIIGLGVYEGGGANVGDVIVAGK
jgi:acetyl-CoA carboxylase carboxyltransferase component